MVSKGFALPQETRHYQFLRSYEENKSSFQPEITSYYQTILSQNSQDHEFYHLPPNLKIQPIWWAMPWGAVIRKAQSTPLSNRADKANAHANKLTTIYESIKSNGYKPWKGRAISGYILQHPEFGEIFNYIDGHHRLAILSLLRDNNFLSTDNVKVLPIATIKRDNLLQIPSCKNGIKAGYFTEEDALLLFDNAFKPFVDRNLKSRLSDTQ
jgi:hypothetical protein